MLNKVSMGSGMSPADTAGHMCKLHTPVAVALAVDEVICLVHNRRSYYQQQPPQQEHMECFPLSYMYHIFLAKHYQLPSIG
eukprot:scaffold22460_cov39-Attheya_sp.AAC.1